MSEVLFVGLGSMDSKMARGLVAAGDPVWVRNRSKSPHFAELLAAGTTRVRSLRETLDADPVISVVTHGRAMLDRFTAGGGRTARRGTVHVNMTNIGATREEGKPFLTSPAPRDVYESTVTDPAISTLEWSVTVEAPRSLDATTESE